MKLHKYLGMALCACLFAAVSACSDDDVTPVPLEKPVGEVTNVSYNTLTFKWNKVAGATQYGYRLLDDLGRELKADVTVSTTATFTGLQPNTPYSLHVWAYAPYGGDSSTSPEQVIEMRTDDLTQIEAPVVTVSRSGAAYIVTWAAQTGAADYQVVITDAEGNAVSQGQGYADGEGSWSYSVSGLAAGTYTAAVTSVPEEGYRGASGSVEFVVTRVAQWTVEGTYTCAETGKTWTARLAFYGDGEYSILNWYGAEGYDLSFVIDDSDPEDMFYLSEQYTQLEDWYIQVPTGNSEKPNVDLYPWYNYCSFSGDVKAGTIKLYTRYTQEAGKYDRFEWKSSAITTDALVGDWVARTTGQEYLNSNDWQDIDMDYTITVKKVSDTEVTLGNFFYEGDEFTAVLDPVKRTLTIKPQTAWTYYILAGGESADEGCVGTISEDGQSVTFANWGVWYDGYNYVYNTLTVLTK